MYSDKFNLRRPSSFNRAELFVYLQIKKLSVSVYLFIYAAK